MSKRSNVFSCVISFVLVVLVFFPFNSECKAQDAWSEWSEYKIQQMYLGTIGAVGSGLLTCFVYQAQDALADNHQDEFYMAKNTRGLFDGLDRETHFVGGLGLYYWMRHTGNTKSSALMKTVIASLAWELKDGLKFMDYEAPWFHQTSVGNLLIHFAGDGFDIKDHYCVMVGAGTAIVFEYVNELYDKLFPDHKKLFSFYTGYNEAGLQLRF